MQRDESTIGASYVGLERAGFAAAPAPRLVDEVDRELARGMGAGAG